MTNSTFELCSSSPFVGEMTLTIVAAQSAPSAVIRPALKPRPPTPIPSGSARCLVAVQERTHEISNVDAVELIGPNPQKDERYQKAAHSRSYSPVWLNHAKN